MANPIASSNIPNSTLQPIEEITSQPEVQACNKKLTPDSETRQQVASAGQETDIDTKGLSSRKTETVNAESSDGPEIQGAGSRAHSPGSLEVLAEDTEGEAVSGQQTTTTDLKISNGATTPAETEPEVPDGSSGQAVSSQQTADTDENINNDSATPARNEPEVPDGPDELDSPADSSQQTADAEVNTTPARNESETPDGGDDREEVTRQQTPDSNEQVAEITETTVKIVIEDTASGEVLSESDKLAGADKQADKQHAEADKASENQRTAADTRLGLAADSQSRDKEQIDKKEFNRVSDYWKEREKKPLDTASS